MINEEVAAVLVTFSFFFIPDLNYAFQLTRAINGHQYLFRIINEMALNLD